MKDHSAYKRWEMTSFGDERRATVARQEAEHKALVETAQLLNLPTEQELSDIRDNAQAEGYAEGRAEGHAEGLAAGLAEGRAQAAGELARVREIAHTFGQAVAHADETIASDVLELALHLARSMVRSAFEVRPELVIPVVREAIEYLPVLQQPALLMLHPDDAPIVREGIGEELDKGGWRVVDDPTVARGGCRIDTASNQIDAQAATRWARLAHALGKNVEWMG